MALRQGQPRAVLAAAVAGAQVAAAAPVLAAASALLRSELPALSHLPLLQQRGSHAAAQAVQRSCGAAGSGVSPDPWQASTFDVPVASRREAVLLWREATVRWRTALLHLSSHRAGPRPRPPAPPSTQPAAAPAGGGSSSGGHSAAGRAAATLTLRSSPVEAAVHAEVPPWLMMTPEERHSQLERFYQQQQHHHYVWTPPAMAAHAASYTPALPFLGVGFAVPEQAPPLPEVGPRTAHPCCARRHAARHGALCTALRPAAAVQPCVPRPALSLHQLPTSPVPFRQLRLW